MDKKEFERFFKREILPTVRKKFEGGGKVDRPARREEWNNLIDMLVEDRELPKKALDWECPW